MKLILRLGGFYCLKLRNLINRVHRQNAPDKRGAHAGNLPANLAFLPAFSCISPDIFRESIGAYSGRIRENHGYCTDTTRAQHARWQNKGRRKSGVNMLGLGIPWLIPCSSLPSLTLPSGPLPICPAYTSVKSAKSGTLAKGKRLHSGRKADRERYGMELGSLRGDTGDRLKPASELSANSEQPRFALDCLGPNQDTTKSKPRPNQGTTKFQSHLQECPVRRWSVARPSTAWDWFGNGNTIVRQLLSYASAFSRRVAEGLSKASRTLVEALSKDCRTSLEQQSNTCRRNFEESCVWTHAKAPARSGLGLALGMICLMLCISSVPSAGQTKNGVISEKDADLERFPKVRHDPDLSKVIGLVPGDTIPDYLWDLPLWVINHPDGKDTITLREYEHGKLLVLDFWATWCAPCIKSVEKWIDIQRHYPGEIDVVTVHMDFDYKALPFVQHRGWQYPVVIGQGRILVGRHFFTKQKPGGVVLIKDGKLFSIPSWRSYDTQVIGDILSGKTTSLPSETLSTYYGNLIKQDTIN